MSGINITRVTRVVGRSITIDGGDLAVPGAISGVIHQRVLP